MYGYVFEKICVLTIQVMVLKVKTGDGIYGGSDKLIPKVKSIYV